MYHRPGDNSLLALPDGRKLAPLDAEFFASETVTVARALVGAWMAVGPCAGRIVETEAYTDDPASHAVTRSKQAAAMRETFGHVYVYRIYGMHYCLNFTTDRAGVGAVLIRAVEPMAGIEEMIARRGNLPIEQLASGPGRLCHAFGIDLDFNGQPIGNRLHVYEADRAVAVTTGPRIGISQAKDLPWRFCEAGSQFLSRKPPRVKRK